MSLVVLNCCVHLHNVWRIIVSCTEQLIANNVGDNAGWILCIWVLICLDHFAVSTCVVLVVSSSHSLAQTRTFWLWASLLLSVLLAFLCASLQLWLLWTCSSYERGEVNWTQAQVSVPMISTIDDHCHFLGIMVCTAWDIFISMLSTQGCQELVSILIWFLNHNSKPAHYALLCLYKFLPFEV